MSVRYTRPDDRSGLATSSNRAATQQIWLPGDPVPRRAAIRWHGCRRRPPPCARAAGDVPVDGPASRGHLLLKAGTARQTGRGRPGLRRQKRGRSRPARGRGPARRPTRPGRRPRKRVRVSSIGFEPKPKPRSPGPPPERNTKGGTNPNQSSPQDPVSPDTAVRTALKHPLGRFRSPAYGGAEAGACGVYGARAAWLAPIVDVVANNFGGGAPSGARPSLAGYLRPRLASYGCWVQDRMAGCTVCRSVWCIRRSSSVETRRLFGGLAGRSSCWGLTTCSPMTMCSAPSTPAEPLG